MVDDFATLLKSYRVSRVTSDRYAGEFPRELFRKHGIAYDLAKQTKSELFRDLLPLLNSGRIVLPRNDRLQGQIVGLERRTSAVGRDTISHPDRGHDDVANAVAGAAALSKFGGYDTSLRWVSGDDDSDPPGSASVFKPSLTAGGASDYDGVSRALSSRERQASCATPTIVSPQSYVWRADGEVALCVGRPSRPARPDL